MRALSYFLIFLAVRKCLTTKFVMRLDDADYMDQAFQTFLSYFLTKAPQSDRTLAIQHSYAVNTRSDPHTLSAGDPSYEEVSVNTGGSVAFQPKPLY